MFKTESAQFTSTVKEGRRSAIFAAVIFAHFDISACGLRRTESWGPAKDFNALNIRSAEVKARTAFVSLVEASQ